jgi:hypothetical protein
VNRSPHPQRDEWRVAVFIPASDPCFPKTHSTSAGRYLPRLYSLEPMPSPNGRYGIGPSQNPVPPNTKIHRCLAVRVTGVARQGRARMREIARKDQVAIEHLTASLLAALVRPPTTVETI